MEKYPVFLSKCHKRGYHFTEGSLKEFENRNFGQKSVGNYKKQFVLSGRDRRTA